LVADSVAQTQRLPRRTYAQSSTNLWHNNWHNNGEGVIWLGNNCDQLT